MKEYIKIGKLIEIKEKYYNKQKTIFVRMRKIINKNLGCYFEIATNGYKGGDGGHGSRTYFLIDILNSKNRYETDKKILTYYNFNDGGLKTFYNGFYIYLAGDWELDSLKHFLKFIYRVINYLSTGKTHKSLNIKNNNNEISFTLNNQYKLWTSYNKAIFKKNNSLYLRFKIGLQPLSIYKKINSFKSISDFSFYFFDLNENKMTELKNNFFNINVLLLYLIYNKNNNVEKYLSKEKTIK